MSHARNLPTRPDALDSLQSAISDAIEALVAWNIPAFECAVDRQRAACDCLAVKSDWRQFPGTAATAKKIHRLSQVYDRLLQHSVHWTRIVHSILERNREPFSPRSSVDFRG
jgi:hypothetical protein